MKYSLLVFESTFHLSIPLKSKDSLKDLRQISGCLAFRGLWHHHGRRGEARHWRAQGSQRHRWT